MAAKDGWPEKLLNNEKIFQQVSEKNRKKKVSQKMLTSSQRMIPNEYLQRHHKSVVGGQKVANAHVSLFVVLRKIVRSQKFWGAITNGSNLDYIITYW